MESDNQAYGAFYRSVKWLGEAMWGHMARPKGFEPLTSAFGGQLSEACGRLPGGIAYRQPEKSHSPALKRSGTHRTSLSLLSVLLCYDVFFSNSRASHL